MLAVDDGDHHYIFFNFQIMKMKMKKNNDSIIPIDISKLSLNSELTNTDLFGGALKLSIPSKWRDVSTVRQVPDHQEVYQDCTTDSGGCVIVEILERQNDVSDNDAPEFFFNDLADVNKGDDEVGSSARSLHYTHVSIVGKNEHQSTEGKESAEINLMPNLSARTKACTCVGTQNVGLLRNKEKTEEGKASKVKVELCVVRLETIQTDLLISLSVPMFENQEDEDKQVENDKKEGHSSLFLSILKSFKVVDWSLFC